MFSQGRSKLKSKQVTTVVQEVVAPTITFNQVHFDEMMSTTVTSLQNSVALKEAEILAKTSEIASLTSDLATAQAAYNALLASNTATSEQLTLAQAQVLTLQGQITVLQSDLATANATILDLQDQLANSGGGGGALEPYIGNLNDAAWTYFPGQTSGASAQPQAAFLDSYAYNSQTKTHSFTTKSITVADTAYAINNGAEFIGPMWYQLATYSDGSPVMIGDSFSFTVRMENVTKDANMANYLIALDLFEWPYKDNNFDKFKLNYQRPVGFCAVLSGGSVKGFGTHVNNNTTVVNTASNTELIEAVGTVVTPGGAQNSSRPSWTIYWSGNYNVRNATLNTVYHTASTEVGQLYLGLLVSSNGAVTTTGGTTSMRISYSIGKLK